MYEEDAVGECLSLNSRVIAPLAGQLPADERNIHRACSTRLPVFPKYPTPRRLYLSIRATLPRYPVGFEAII